MYESKVEIRMGIVGMLIKKNTQPVSTVIEQAKAIEQYVIGEACIQESPKDMYTAMQEMLEKMPRFEPPKITDGSLVPQPGATE